MPALSATTRFFLPEITNCVFVPTIAASTKIPTRAELTAGTTLTKEIADISGWGVKSNMIDTPDAGSRFVSQIGGRTNVDSSSITFYADITGSDVRQTLPRNQTGYIVWMDGGDVATQKMDIFPVKVTSVGKVRSSGDQAMQLTIEFAVTSPPAEDAPIPA